jgi:hypothetical protein
MPRPVVPPRLTRGELVAGCVPVGALLHASVWGCSPGRCSRWLPHGGGLELRTDRVLDREFAELLHERATRALTYLFEAISSLGSSRTLSLVAFFAVVLLVSRRRLLDTLLVIVALVGAEVLDSRGQGRLSARAPCLRRSHRGACIGLSFPSAHAGASMALYGALAFLLARDLKSTRARRLLPCSTVAHWRDRLLPPVPGRALPLGCPGWIEPGPRVDHALRSLDRARPDSRRRRRPG